MLQLEQVQVLHGCLMLEVLHNLWPLAFMPKDDYAGQPGHADCVHHASEQKLRFFFFIGKEQPYLFLKSISITF